MPTRRGPDSPNRLQQNAQRSGFDGSIDGSLRSARPVNREPVKQIPSTSRNSKPGGVIFGTSGNLEYKTVGIGDLFIPNTGVPYWKTEDGWRGLFSGYSTVYPNGSNPSPQMNWYDGVILGPYIVKRGNDSYISDMTVIGSNIEWEGYNSVIMGSEVSATSPEQFDSPTGCYYSVIIGSGTTISTESLGFSVILGENSASSGNGRLHSINVIGWRNNVESTVDGEISYHTVLGFSNSLKVLEDRQSVYTTQIGHNNRIEAYEGYGISQASALGYGNAINAHTGDIQNATVVGWGSTVENLINSSAFGHSVTIEKADNSTAVGFSSSIVGGGNSTLVGFNSNSYGAQNASIFGFSNNVGPYGDSSGPPDLYPTVVGMANTLDAGGGEFNHLFGSQNNVSGVGLSNITAVGFGNSASASNAYMFGQGISVSASYAWGVGHGISVGEAERGVLGARKVEIARSPTLAGSDYATGLILHSEDDTPVELGATDAGKITEEGVELGWVDVPASASSLGIPGQKAYDGTYVYICTGTDTWLRAPITTW